MLLGGIVVFLLMKLRMAATEATSSRLSDELCDSREALSRRNNELQAMQEQINDYMQQSSSMGKELEMLQRAVEEERTRTQQQKEATSQKEAQLEVLQESVSKLNADKNSLQKEIELTKQALDEEKRRTQEQTSLVQNKQGTIEKLQETIAQENKAHEGINKELALLSNQFAEQKEVAARRLDEIERLTNRLDGQKELTAKTESERDTALKEVSLLKEQMQKNEQERADALAQQLAMAKEQLQNATQEILKQREESLGKTNTEQMTNVVKPLKEQLEAMQKQVMENIKSNTESKTTIEEAIRSLMQRAQEMSTDANNLARALKNESKTQGNWGEMILETLLENSGLEEGVHYEKQGTLRDVQGKVITHDETGKRLIPDVVVHYPDGKDCVIDSKVSLSDYIDYCNAENDAARSAALERHLASVRKHVKELAGKDYASYIKAPRQSMGYTIMFVPNESAMQVALQADNKLWHAAFEKGVCITSGQNLLVLLRMIKMAWTQVQQAQNQQEVFDQAKRLLDRVADFVERFDKVGEQIRKADEAFGSARGKLYDGQQSIIKAAKDMEKLGAKTSGKRALPEPSDWRN